MLTGEQCRAAAESYELVAERRIELASVYGAGADQAIDVARALRLAGYLLTARPRPERGQELAAAANLLDRMRMQDLLGQPWTVASLAAAVRAAEDAEAQAQERRHLDHAEDLVRAAGRRLPDT